MLGDCVRCELPGGRRGGAGNRLVSDVGKPIAIAPIGRPDFILEEAFSPTLVERASSHVLEDTFAVLQLEKKFMSPESRAMVDALTAECLDESGLTMDAIEAAGLILDRCERVRAQEKGNLKRLPWFETYIDHDIPVATKRLEYRRAMDVTHHVAPRHASANLKHR